MREETRCRHIGYSFRLAARVLLYASSHRQDNTYHSLCYTSRGALAGTINSSVGPPHEGSIRRPIAPWANALTTELHLAQVYIKTHCDTDHSTEGVEAQGDLGDVLPLPQVHRLEALWRWHAVFPSSIGEPLDVLHQCEAAAFLVDLLDTARHQFVH